MSVNWSSEIMKLEYRDLQATAMSVDYTGNNVLLAGRRWLAIKQIGFDDDCGDIIIKYPRHSKYDAAGAEWCHTQQGQKLCAITVSILQCYSYFNLFSKLNYRNILYVDVVVF